VGAVSGVSRQFAKQKDGRAVWCWAGVGADSSLRIVVARYAGTTADAARINDLTSRLYFDVRPPRLRAETCSTGRGFAGR
jgi:hypothetical protein